MRKIIFVSDYACPWCYMMIKYLKELKDDGVVFELQPVAFMLAPDAPLSGESLFKLYPKEHVHGTYERLKPAAMKYGIEFDPDAKLFNTVLAHLVGKFMNRAGKYLDYSDRVFESYFVKSENIALVEVLKPIVEELGESWDEAVEFAGSKEGEEIVASDAKYVFESGIRSVPTLVTEDGTMIQGVRDAEDLKNRLS